MTVDEINAGLARYLWPDHKIEVQAESDAVYVEHANGSGFYHRLFTMSLDACERVADKLGVDEIRTTIAAGQYWARTLGARGRHEGGGPTRAHALAAALYAAVQSSAAVEKED